MHTLTPEALKTLIQKQTGPCLSLFMPPGAVGTKPQQSQIHFRNLLRKAEEILAAHGLKPQDIKAFMEPLSGITGQALFRKNRRDGLALFHSRGLMNLYALPLDVAELVIVGDRFHVKPLLPHLGDENRFFLLALSQKAVRLFEGSRFGLRERPLEHCPRSLEEALQYDEPERQVRFRSRAGAETATRSGHGAGADQIKDDILKFFRLIDRGLRDPLKEEKAPLVLAGVEYLFPIYRDANTYPYLMDEGIQGNPEEAEEEDLHRQALQILKPYYEKAEHDAIAQYRQSSGTGLTATDVREIVPAAVHGRVGILLVASGRQQWGVFTPESGAVTLHAAMKPGDEDLLDVAAIQTFINGGEVHILPPGKIPGQEVLAAVYRY
jgi:hypothetical protein